MKPITSNIVVRAGLFVLYIQKFFLNSSQARSLSRQSLKQAQKAQNIACQSLKRVSVLIRRAFYELFEVNTRSNFTAGELVIPGSYTVTKAPLRSLSPTTVVPEELPRSAKGTCPSSR